MSWFMKKQSPDQEYSQMSGDWSYWEEGSAARDAFDHYDDGEPRRRTRMPESSAPYREGAYAEKPMGNDTSGSDRYGVFHGQERGTLNEFKRKIEKCECRIANIPQRGWKKWGRREKWIRVLLNIFLWGIPFLLRVWFPIFRFDRNLALSDTEKEKLAIIDNFCLADDRDTTIEALNYIRGKMESLCDAHAMERPDFWMGVWKNKANQLCSQAELYGSRDAAIIELQGKIEELCVMKQNNMRLRRAIFLVLIALEALFLVLVWSGNASVSFGTMKAQYIWPENEFTELLPDPISERGKILAESTETFSIEFYNVRQIQFENYIVDCKENGFTEEFNRAENVCTASNSDGYLLVLSYDEKEKSMTVTVSYPEDAQSAGMETE